MGISVEFSPELALRNFEQFKSWNCRKEECIPDKMVVGQEYEFLKKGQRVFWMEGEVALVETKGDGKTSRPKASIIITEVKHVMEDGKLATRGRYKIVEVFSDDKVHFESCWRVKEPSSVPIIGMTKPSA
jgi:hypothetical protein